MDKQCQAERSRSLRPNQFTLPSGAVITEHPILFQTEMVKAILERRKTQTRRIVKAKGKSNWSPPSSWSKPQMILWAEKFGGNRNPGDLLWVKETWQESTWLPKDDEDYGFIYRASENGRDWELSDDFWIWKPSIHMPKAASRIWAMVEDIRVERVQEISEEDARAEGISKVKTCLSEAGAWANYNLYDDDCPYFFNPKHSFGSLWESINGEESWRANPWVWVIQFRVLSTTGKPSQEVIEQNYLEVTANCALGLPTGKEAPNA